MWTALCDRFASPRLRQLFGRYATYCGSSPFQAPATLNLVAHVEAEGVYRALGGMRSVASALEALARSKGVTFRYGREVDRVVVERGRVTAVGTRQEQFPADVVVFNGDVSAIGGLLSDGGARAPSPTPARARSLSAVTWLLRARTSGAALGHHNVFFSDDYRAEFDELDRSRRMPAQPTVYVCAQDRGDGAEGPAIERLLVLSNAPATGDEPARWDDRERARCTTSTFGWLERLGLTVDPMESVQTTPVEFHARFPATGGALYGARSDSPLSALSRQGAKSNIDGLYFAGGSVHPGPGVPMATLSGRLAASQILADLE
jgi:1-hydroxycarotenoid 3,4-desaturase